MKTVKVEQHKLNHFILGQTVKYPKWQLIKWKLDTKASVRFDKDVFCIDDPITLNIKEGSESVVLIVRKGPFSSDFYCAAVGEMKNIMNDCFEIVGNVNLKNT